MRLLTLFALFVAPLAASGPGFGRQVWNLTRNTTTGALAFREILGFNQGVPPSGGRAAAVFCGTNSSSCLTRCSMQ